MIRFCDEPGLTEPLKAEADQTKQEASSRGQPAKAQAITNQRSSDRVAERNSVLFLTRHADALPLKIGIDLFTRQFKGSTLVEDRDWHSRELVELHGGSISLGNSTMGGLEVSVVLSQAAFQQRPMDLISFGNTRA